MNENPILNEIDLVVSERVFHQRFDRCTGDFTDSTKEHSNRPDFLDWMLSEKPSPRASAASKSWS
jgi:hypothetical protein